VIFWGRASDGSKRFAFDRHHVKSKISQSLKQNEEVLSHVDGVVEAIARYL
jgi:hypothetical protein